MPAQFGPAQRSRFLPFPTLPKLSPQGTHSAHSDLGELCALCVKIPTSLTAARFRSFFPLPTKSNRMIFLAAPYDLTPMESYSCKKQGWGVPYKQANPYIPKFSFRAKSRIRFSSLRYFIASVFLKFERKSLCL